MNAVCSLVPEIDLIDVGFENLLLGPFVLEVDGHHGFSEFSHPELVRFEPECAYQLHRQRGRSLFLPAIPDIHVCRSHNAPQIEAVMLKETFVFGRDYRVDENMRD